MFVRTCKLFILIQIYVFNMGSLKTNQNQLLLDEEFIMWLLIYMMISYPENDFLWKTFLNHKVFCFHLGGQKTLDHPKQVKM